MRIGLQVGIVLLWLGVAWFTGWHRLVWFVVTLCGLVGVGVNLVWLGMTLYVLVWFSILSCYGLVWLCVT